jgi:hypothetical protein
MQKGFGYIYFLFLTLAVFIFMASLSRVILNYRYYKNSDLANLQAKAMADSAHVYYSGAAPLLINNNESELDLKKLRMLQGEKLVFNNSGFKIVKNKDRIYLLGFAGKDIANADSYYVLLSEGGKLTPWY